ncbi:MAG TPA: FG-GAP-like repeat-containing protein [Bacteroidota bacterium]|nr:FG-GAP-like repeat-containing protein [Bacteroidota bacterium]
METNKRHCRVGVSHISIHIFSFLLFVSICVSGTTGRSAQEKAGSKEEMDQLGSMASSYYQKISSGQQPSTPKHVDAISGHTFNSQEASSRYGMSVASAGDVNGDGYSDVIIAAPAYSSNTGRVYIYYGGPGMDNIPDIILTGEATDNFFGYSASTAGDVNGDGYSDVIVGAYGYSTSIGRAYIYYGGRRINTTPDVILTGGATENYFGYSVSSAGDVNGDGYSDVIVGMHGYSSQKGRACIYYGGPKMDNTADITLTGEAYSHFGYSVSTAGDVNGDGFSDVIVGAYGYSSSTGRAYIYFGGRSMNTTADVTLTGEANYNDFGNSVSTAGDVNGDGYSDVIVGAFAYSSGTGRAYIYFGGATMNNAADVTLTGEGTENSFGSAVSTAGDVNGDGYSDVIVGAYANSSYAGRAYVFFGGASMNNRADVTLKGEGAQNFFGSSVSTAGDVNGDGCSDIIVGAYGYDNTTGRAYLYSNSLTGTDLPDEKFTGQTDDDFFGSSISTAGDVNGDGYSDVIVGAAGSSPSADSGRAYIYYGGPNMDNIPDITLTGEANGNSFGHSVSTAGDVNGDGYSDVIVGALGYSSQKGRAYIYYGGPKIDNIPDVILTGEGTGNFFGIAVSTAGDVNGDGYSDVIVGANYYSSSKGRAYIYYGGQSMDTTADVIFTGEANDNKFGASVATAGDVNGDGYSDVIVGAEGYSSSTGRAYIYYGGRSMHTTADVTLTGEANSNEFGHSVSTAGDVNGDGYSDVIIGAKGYSNSIGRAYIYYGGAGMKNTADVILTGEAIYNYFGHSVSTAGDVNGDGYSDIIVGAYYYSSTGRVYIYYGGTSMDNIADVTLTDKATMANFGFSVSTAGDVNGDGYSDVIVEDFFREWVYLYKSSPPPIVPRIASVSDVPYDQGGVVDVRWIRSAYDTRNISRVRSYRLERSNPPGVNGFAWTTVADITASHNLQYNYPVQTPYDSISAAAGDFYFRITAVTDNVNEYWRSNILSGHSVDNISPSAVSGGKILPQTNGSMVLVWNKNRTDADLKAFQIHRSIVPRFALSDSTILAQTTDTTYTDAATTKGTVYYYKIAAVDIHGNIGTPSMELSEVVTSVNVNGEVVAPRVFALSQNYPNPFNPTTTIQFTVREEGHATLRVYNMLGQEVATLFDGMAKAGAYHQALFTAQNLASGIYIVRLESNGNRAMKKMMLLK